MKSLLLLLLSLFLSLFSGDRHKAVAVVSSGDGASCCYAEASSPDTEADHALCRDLCFTATQGQAFSGAGGSNSVSFRNTHSGRRTSSQTRSSFRIIKGGKVIDNNRTHPFLTPVFVPLSGMHVSDRYLFSICRLRL